MISAKVGEWVKTAFPQKNGEEEEEEHETIEIDYVANSMIGDEN